MPETDRPEVEVIDDFDVTLETLNRQKARIVSLVGDDPAIVAALDRLESLAIDYGQKLAY